MIDTMSMEKFASYWFQNFGAVMLLGNIESADEVTEGRTGPRNAWAVSISSRTIRAAAATSAMLASSSQTPLVTKALVD